MFVLRRITKSGRSLNFSIGKFYSLTHSDDEEFERDMEALGAANDDVKLLVNPEPDVTQPIPVFKTDQAAYIMTESGKTFQRIN